MSAPTEMTTKTEGIISNDLSVIDGLLGGSSKIPTSTSNSNVLSTFTVYVVDPNVAITSVEHRTEETTILIKSMIIKSMMHHLSSADTRVKAWQTWYLTLCGLAFSDFHQILMSQIGMARASKDYITEISVVSFTAEQIDDISGSLDDPQGAIQITYPEISEFPKASLYPPRFLIDLDIETPMVIICMIMTLAGRSFEAEAIKLFTGNRLRVLMKTCPSYNGELAHDRMSSQAYTGLMIAVNCASVPMRKAISVFLQHANRSEGIYKGVKYATTIMFGVQLTHVVLIARALRVYPDLAHFAPVESEVSRFKKDVAELDAAFGTDYWKSLYSRILVTRVYCPRSNTINLTALSRHLLQIMDPSIEDYFVTALPTNMVSAFRQFGTTCEGRLPFPSSLESVQERASLT